MAGITSILEKVRQEVAQARTASRKRFSAVQEDLDDKQAQIDELERRLDKLDTPAQTQTRKTSKKAPSKKRRAVPVPDRPEAMQGAGVGNDPR